MQAITNDFLNKHKLRTDAKTRYIDLISEIGELGAEITKSTEYGKKDFTVTSQMIDEIGDCVFSLLALCNELNIDAEEALHKSLAKYMRRFESKGSIGSCS